MDGSKKGDEKEGQLPIEIVRIKPGGETSPIPTPGRSPFGRAFLGREAGDRNYEKLLFTFGLNYSRINPRNGPPLGGRQACGSRGPGR